MSIECTIGDDFLPSVSTQLKGRALPLAGKGRGLQLQLKGQINKTPYYAGRTQYKLQDRLIMLVDCHKYIYLQKKISLTTNLYLSLQGNPLKMDTRVFESHHERNRFRRPLPICTQFGKGLSQVKTRTKTVRFSL